MIPLNLRVVGATDPQTEGWGRVREPLFVLKPTCTICRFTRHHNEVSIVLVTLTGVVSACEKQGRMKPRILPSERREWQTLWACWALSLTITLLACPSASATRSQEPPLSAQSIADAARNARAQKSNSTAPPRV